MIDKEKVIDGLTLLKRFLPSTMWETINDALALLKEQELIRCKDCKWWDKKDGANYGYCHACKHGYYSDHWEIGIYRTYKGDWFCADGERKDK